MSAPVRETPSRAHGQPTPAPWGWVWVSADTANGGGHLYIIDSGSRKIAACWGKADEKEANARLIALAPELADALRALLSAFDDNPTGLDMLYASNLARALLAKLDGRAP